MCGNKGIYMDRPALRIIIEKGEEDTCSVSVLAIDGTLLEVHGVKNLSISDRRK
jgi:hypothetical protein